MHIDLYKTIAGAIIGFIIGLTGMGGGALMTPVLVLIFGVSPGTAVSADVVTSLLLKPFGGGVHIRRRTVCWRLVRWLMAGSMPAAFGGAYLLHRVIGENNGSSYRTDASKPATVGASLNETSISIGCPTSTCVGEITDSWGPRAVAEAGTEPRVSMGATNIVEIAKTAVLSILDLYTDIDPAKHVCRNMFPFGRDGT